MKYLIRMLSLVMVLTSFVCKASASEPFIGMTDKEATTVLTLVHWTLKFNGKILKAQVKDSANQHYILFFDGGTPNRLKMWSAFTDEEVKELTELPEFRPRPQP